MHDSTFNLVDGSVPVRVCMALVEEVLVVALYLVLGFVLGGWGGGAQQGTGEIEGRAWKERRGRERGNRNLSGSRGRRGGGAIRMVLTEVARAHQERERR